jgi:FAD-dependent oxidoreductase domain-containing protein 1
MGGRPDVVPDIVIVGGGVVGSAVAYFLRRDGDCRVTVIERDTTYARASSSLSCSAIRQQFSCPVNIGLSRFGIEFLRRAGEHLCVDGDAPAIGLREPGYLYLAGPDGEPVLRGNHAVQRAHGAQVALLDPESLRERFPWMATDGVVAGSLGLEGEGWFDGPALMRAFRQKARSLGAEYRLAEAVGFERAGDAISSVMLADGERVPCGAVVNAAGPYARVVAAWAGLHLPVEARRRSVFVLACKAALPACPLVIDASGVWFRPEGDRFLSGWSPPEEEDPERLALDVDHEQFEDVVWPALAARVPGFEAVRVTGSWAGHYDYNTFDHNALLGRMPGVPNLYFANGFSGHGMQQAAGAGRGVSELILYGRYMTLDLSDLDVARVPEGRELRELNII